MSKRICGHLFVVVLWASLLGVTWSSEHVIYVDGAASGANHGSSWTNAYLYLQDALAAASTIAEPIEIRIAQGVYRPDQGADVRSVRQTNTFQLLNNVALKGGYAGGIGSDPNTRDVERHQTVLSGDLAGDDHPDDAWDSPNRHDNCWAVLTGREIDGTTVLDGLTITGASNHGMDLQLASPSLNRCRFVDNGFAGIDAWDCNSVLVDCTFERNGYGVIADGGFWCARGNLTLTDCAFIQNDGSGIDNSGTLDLLRCSFVANTGFRGAAIKHSGDLTARRCIFQSNRSRTGGVVECLRTAALIDCDFTDNSATQAGAIDAAGSLTLTDCRFVGNSGSSLAGAVMIAGDMLNARGCLFAGNAGPWAGAILNHSAAILRLSNCTFTGNRGRPNAVEHPPIPGAISEMTQCIVWDGPDPFTAYPAFPPGIVATYSNIQGGYAGEGNIDVDPLFVDPGYWDTNDTPADANDDIWVTGDYHLKSQAGHWDRASASWVFDDVTSPCIDAGDPNAPLGNEPSPNGGFVNLGTYAGTSEASRSYFGMPICETHIAGDINGDCKVDDLDTNILMSHWLMETVEADNVPPTVTLLSPAEGAEFTAGMPMVLRAETSDPDGRVIRVHYRLTSRSENGISMTGATAMDPTNNWEVTWDGWSNVTIAPDRTYTIQAEAMDDQGAKTVTPEVEIKLSL